MFKDILNNNAVMSLIMVVIIIIISFILHILVKRLTKSKLIKSIESAGSHAKTYVHVIQGICNTAIVLLAIYFILLVFGYDVRGMLAGVGVVGIVVGFALQDLLKDIIAAFGLIADGAFDVGSHVGINEYVGEIVEFNLRKTTILDSASACPVTLNNRDIKEVTNIAEYFSYNLPLSNDLIPMECNMITGEILSLVKAVPNVDDAENLGIQYFTDSTIVYKLRVYCDTMNRLPVTRAINGVVFDYYYEHDMKVVQKDVKLYCE